MVQGSVCLLSPEACAAEDGAAFPSLHTVFLPLDSTFWSCGLQLLGVSCANVRSLYFIYLQYLLFCLTQGILEFQTLQ